MEDIETKICYNCKQTREKQYYSKTQWKKIRRKCKICQSNEKHNDNIITPQDNNISDNEDNTEYGNDNNLMTKVTDTTPTHLYAHEDGTWHRCIISLTILQTDTIVITLLDPPQANKMTYITPQNKERLRPYAVHLVNNPHNLQIQQKQDQQTTPSAQTLNENTEKTVRSEIANDILTNGTEGNKNVVNKQVRFNLELETGNINKNSNNNNENNGDINKDNDNKDNDINEYDNIKQQLQQTNLTALEIEEYIKYKQNQIQRIDTNTTKPDISDATNYTKQIYEDNMVPKFTATFPTNQATFWIYLNDITRYRNEYIFIDEQRILNKILITLKDSIRDEWNQYKRDKYVAICQQRNYDTKNRKHYQEIYMELQTFKMFELYMIDKFRVEPSIQYFKGQVHYVRMGYDENPVDTFTRLRGYINQVKIAIDTFNSNREPKDHIEHLSERFIMEETYRVFVWDNNQSILKNNGALNRKVRQRLEQWWRDNKHPSIDELRQQINKVQYNVLPPNMINEKIEGQHWKKVKMNLSIFQMKPVSELNKRKRKLDRNDNNNNGNSPKRQRIDTKYRDNKRCKFKDKCKNYLNTGKCEYYHIAAELRAMQRDRGGRNNRGRSGNNRGRPNNRSSNQIRSDTRPYQSSNRFNRGGGNSRGRRGRGHGNNSDRRRFSSDTNGNRDKSTQFCRYGDKCTKYQDGKCEYKHDRFKIVCQFCGKPGHPKYKCYNYKASQTQQPPPHYNPYQQPNAQQPQALFHTQYPVQTPMQYPTYPPSYTPTITPSTTPIVNTLPQNNPTNVNLALQKHQKIQQLNDAKKQFESIKRELGAIKHHQKMNMTPNQYGSYDIYTPRHQ